MISEDFSFPKITNPIPHFAISPSLWRVSSVVYPDFFDDNNDELAMKTPTIFLKNEEFEDGDRKCSEERMDLLWEELERVSSLGKKKQGSSNNRSDCETGGGDEVQLCCVEAFKLSKRGSMYQPKKQSLVLVVKVLKKILLLHKSTTTN
ncbi:conserved hypothetical protein [Ricinus communis]|uniref:Uncharacterized protein n=1 Tax=Ricinus communis TaxID=3988 RepID=B9RW90_RICCO|nr:conserved hypothetical protein [Ricinus communis]